MKQKAINMTLILTSGALILSLSLGVWLIPTKDFSEEEKQQFAAFLERAIRNMGGNPCHHKEEETK